MQQLHQLRGRRRLLNRLEPPQTLVESWNGTFWSIVASPNQGSRKNQLNGVSCTSATSCVAVGYYGSYSNNTPQSLVELWNGSSWALSSSPNRGTGTNQLNAVSCTSATNCVAVGESIQNGTTSSQTLAEAWNGTVWTIGPSVNVSSNDRLIRVSCASATSCMAVGFQISGNVDLNFAESWNGTAWTLTPSLNTGGPSQLDGVSCASPTSCTAVGDFTNSSNIAQTLVVSWNGTGWSIISSPAPSSLFDQLDAVSCPSATNCTAVGFALNAAGVSQTLAESWHGTAWSVAPTANLGASANQLNAVSCTSPTNCVAVDSYNNGSATPTLIQAWNGTTWSIVPSPSPGNGNDLYGVSCTSSTSCVAVGDYINANISQTLVESWNGTTWSVVASPNGPGSGNELNAVSCTSPTNCVAVGASGNLTLVEAWNGTAWSITSSPSVEPAPNTNSVTNDLTSVSCTSSTNCKAVGYHYNPSGAAVQTLVESWNGTAWTITSSPNPGTSYDFFQGVSCTSSTSCVAVGESISGSGPALALVETWNGNAWSVTTNPNPAGGGDLVAVSCTATTSCVAVGGSPGGPTLVETLTGSTWSISTSPTLGSSAQLDGVACTNTSCVAVGNYLVGAGGLYQTLTETGPA